MKVVFYSVLTFLQAFKPSDRVKLCFIIEACVGRNLFNDDVLTVRKKDLVSMIQNKFEVVG